MAAPKSGPGPTKTFLTSGAFERARVAYPTCDWKEDFTRCRELVLTLAVGHVGRKEYAIAAKYIDAMYKGVTANGLRTPHPCPYDPVHIGDKFYDVGYYQTVYKIWRGLNSPKAEKYALRAYLCASLNTSNYQANYYYSDDFSSLSRKDFINTFKKSHADDPRFDVATYLDDVLAAVIPVRREINKGKITHSTYTKEVALFENAARRCDSLGLDAGFGKFFRELAVAHTYYAKDRE